MTLDDSTLAADGTKTMPGEWPGATDYDHNLTKSFGKQRVSGGERCNF